MFSGFFSVSSARGQLDPRKWPPISLCQRRGSEIGVNSLLSPAWVSVLEAEGWQTVHWSSIGPVNAPDAEIMNWARRERSVVVTNDLDFSAIFASTGAKGRVLSRFVVMISILSRWGLRSLM